MEDKNESVPMIHDVPEMSELIPRTKVKITPLKIIIAIFLSLIIVAMITLIVLSIISFQQEENKEQEEPLPPAD